MARGQLGLDREPVRSLPPKLLQAVRRYARQLDDNLAAGRGLWFAGGQGTYKTATAVAILVKAAEEGYTVAYKTVPNLLTDIRALYNDESPLTYGEFMHRLQNVDLLLLDDLGSEMRTEWVLEQLYTLVNERMLEKRAVIVTTNLTIPELELQVTSRVVSRLHQICGEPLQFGGPDARRTPPEPPDSEIHIERPPAPAAPPAQE